MKLSCDQNIKSIARMALSGFGLQLGMSIGLPCMAELSGLPRTELFFLNNNNNISNFNLIYALRFIKIIINYFNDHLSV